MGFGGGSGTDGTSKSSWDQPTAGVEMRMFERDWSTFRASSAVCSNERLSSSLMQTGFAMLSKNFPIVSLMPTGLAMLSIDFLIVSLMLTGFATLSMDLRVVSLMPTGFAMLSMTSSLLLEFSIAKPVALPVRDSPTNHFN